MRVQVLYFQNVRKITGKTGESVEIGPGATVGQLADTLAGRHAGLQAALPSLMFAVNETHAGRADRLNDGDTVAFMPPFSGG